MALGAVVGSGARTNGSVSVWPGYWTGVTTVKLVMVPCSGRSTSCSGPSSRASIGQLPLPPLKTRSHTGHRMPSRRFSREASMARSTEAGTGFR